MTSGQNDPVMEYDLFSTEHQLCEHQLQEDGVTCSQSTQLLHPLTEILSTATWYSCLRPKHTRICCSSPIQFEQATLQSPPTHLLV